MRSFLFKTLNPDLIKNHTKTVVLIWILFILVLPTAIIFMLFLFMGSFTIIDLHLSERSALLLDAFLSIIFFLQHSLLIRRGIRQKLTKFIPSRIL